MVWILDCPVASSSRLISHVGSNIIPVYFGVTSDWERLEECVVVVMLFFIIFPVSAPSVIAVLCIYRKLGSQGPIPSMSKVVFCFDLVGSTLSTTIQQNLHLMSDSRWSNCVQ